MADIALTLPLARRNPVHVPRRDIVAGAGDALRLLVRVAEADRFDAPLVDLRTSFARVRMHVWADATPLNGRGDYALGWRGPLLSTASGMATAQRPDAIEIRVSAGETRGWLGGGRLGWSLQAAVLGGEFALCWGALHMRPGLSMPPLHVLTGEGARVLTAEDEYVVV